MAIINYQLLYEQTRDSYLNPPEHIRQQVLAEPKGEEVLKLQAIYAEAYGHAAAATMKGIEQRADGFALVNAIMLLSISSLRNLLERVTPESREGIIKLATQHFVAGIDPDTEYVVDKEDAMPLNQ
jgi:hypothetical protein